MADSGRTIKRWMTYEPDSVTIGPSRQQNVRLTLNVPDSAAGGYYGCVLLIARPLDSAGAPTTAIPAELNVPIYLVVNPGSQYSGEIDNVEADRTGGGVTFKIVARNTGNIHTVATGSVTVQKWAEDKSVIDSLIVLSKPTFEDVGTVAIEVDSVFILPGERHMLSSQTVERLPVGKYKAIVQVAFGPKQSPVTKEKEFVITKPVEQKEE